MNWIYEENTDTNNANEVTVTHIENVISKKKNYAKSTIALIMCNLYWWKGNIKNYPKYGENIKRNCTVNLPTYSVTLKRWHIIALSLFQDDWTLDFNVNFESAPPSLWVYRSA